MISVVVAANNQDKKFWNAIQNILNRNFSAISCVGNCIDARCERAELLIAEAGSFDLVYSDTAIVVFKDAEAIACGFETKKQTVAIVDSRSPEVLKIASETDFPAITCGLSPKDTITLSSINEDSALIGIQRSITCFDGSVIEPQEIPVSLCSTIDSFALMCAAAIFILSGNINRLLKAEI